MPRRNWASYTSDHGIVRNEAGEAGTSKISQEILEILLFLAHNEKLPKILSKEAI